MLTTEGQPRTAARRKFGGYKPEKPRIVRQCLVEENTAVRAIIKAWDSFGDVRLWRSSEETMERSYRMIAGIDYTLEDLERFNAIMPALQDEDWFNLKAGYFLSVLISCCPAEEITIRTDHLRERINQFGFRNTKKVTVRGSLGTEAGEMMEDGELIVHGHAGNYLGLLLKGGKIEVLGYAEDKIGIQMRGGRIIVHKDAGYNVGYGMDGGVIKVSGDARDVGPMMNGGEIHVNGACEISRDPSPVKGKIYQRGILRFEG